MKEALIIFVKNPEFGKVKTRLAANVGNEKALEIYLKLLEHTRLIVTPIIADKFVYYFDIPATDDLWDTDNFNKRNQHGKNLGERMLNAFKEMFDGGYQNVFIIGSDCFELTTAIIKQGFKEIRSSDIVIGPATDGGYYLLGMKKIHPLLFENINWSTDKVFEQTIAVCQNQHLSCSLLPILNDIDEEADWIKASGQFL